MKRAVVTLLTFVLIVAGITFVPSQAQAISSADFDPGLIISDAEFFNSGSMSQADIQSLLEAREQGCRATYGYPCLKDYRESTATRAASAGRCAAYNGAASEAASQIIWKVATACGISPRVIVVLLEKEQGLVTSLAPTASRYRAATGYGCPDTAPCDAQYYGFYNQVYKAAWQFKTYGVNPSSWRYHPGNVAIQYHPNAACGAPVVNIRNQATADLYNYTPYQPNAASLRNLRGSGDGCSSYGNRNFWVLYNDWFTTGAELIRQAWVAQGGSSGSLGAAASGVLSVSANGGGLGQAFAGGSIYWSPIGGVHTVRGAMRDYWFARGGETGSLGWPYSEEMTETVNGGGSGQAFQYGSVYRSAIGGTHIVSGRKLVAYVAVNGERGQLGWPTGDTVDSGSGSSQTTVAGTLYESASGAFAVVDGPLADAWAATGSTGGSLGWPTSPPLQVSANGGGVGQAFQGGSIYWTKPAGAFSVTGGVRDFYFSQRGESGPLGWPVAAMSCGSDGSCQQAFQGGTVYWSKTLGGRIGLPAIESVWTAAGGVSGSLGRPTSGLLQVSANGGGVGQAFQGGSIYWTKPAGAFSVTGGVRDFYFSQRGESGPLGWPVAAMSCGSDGSCQQAFQGGTVYWSKTLGGRIGLPAIESVWTAAGGVSGSLGKPTSGLLQVSANGGGVGQAFQGGSIYWTKPAGAFSVTGGVRDFYFSQRGESGPLGWPVAAMSCGSDGSCQQAFQGGTVYWSKTLGGRIG